MKFIKLILLLFAFNILTSCSVNTKTDSNFVDTSSKTLKDEFPNTYKNIAPGCIDTIQFEKLKSYLKSKCKIDIDSVGIVNIFYLMPKKRCETDYYIDVKHINLPDNYLKIQGHNSKNYDKYTKLNFPIVFIQNEKEVINSKWINDENDFIYSLFFNYDAKIHCEALLTISKDRSYLLDWEIFKPATFNAFSNELSKYKCE
ncbi:hypothetical protein [Flavobacterium sp.]|uniref:hypothetical protein n=1 Tax=Flavobacterium sp. TaxID=239 RepID=UPI003753B8ED